MPLLFLNTRRCKWTIGGIFELVIPQCNVYKQEILDSACRDNFSMQQEKKK